MGSMQTPIHAVCFYDPADEAYWKQLQRHLTPLQRTGLITLWSAKNLLVGQSRTELIEENLQKAQIIMLLISADFLGGSNDELRQEIQRRQAEGKEELHLIPILLRHADWQHTPFGKLHILPDNYRPVTEWESQDSAFENIVRGIRALVESFSPVQRPAPHMSSDLALSPASTGQMSVPPLLKPEDHMRPPKRFVLLLILACVLIVGFLSVFSLSRGLFSSVGSASIVTPTPTTTLPILPTVGPAPSLIPPGKQPVINDPLKDNSQGYQWDVESSSEGSCNFVQGRYTLTAPAGVNNGVGCNTESSNSIFGNFVYQIQMTILAGVKSNQAEAGPIFRVVTDGSGKQYQVGFNSEGFWSVGSNQRNFSGALCGEPCPYFLKGLNQPNIITIWASGDSIKMQINGYSLGSYTDNAYASGFIGVQLSPGADNSSVAFSNVRVWQL
ncbi:MAG TPA: TIR domain-containing protein [Ktedonobacteraceae bacterium]|nr:TIR domain-containing protein [Ktedonobacteraceae bacterium]